MKRFFLSFLFYALCSFSFGQNLIPNPSAEDYIECPSSLGGLDIYLNDWMPYRGSPDYWNSCSENPLLGWNNSIGYQEPRTGDGYLGLFTFHQGLENARESFGVEFENPLIIGEVYYLSFYISAAYQPVAFNMTSNNIGFLLMVDNFIDNEEQGILPNYSQFHVSEIISDTTTWVNVQTSFVADSAYQHICFGNFFEDQYTDTLRLDGDLSNAISYYYFDDFCLTLNPNECDISSSIDDIENDNISIFPNPTQKNLTVKTDTRILDIEILNMKGQIQNSNSQTTNMNEANVQFNLKPGLYVLNIITEKTLFKKRFVVQ